MSNIFTQNTKMKKFKVHSFGLAPRKTCVICSCPCYGEKGLYRVYKKQCKKRWEYLLYLSEQESFTDLIVEEINRKKNIQTLRIHDTGDFYNQEYLDKWVKIAKSVPHVRIYCYTKSLHLNWKKFDRLTNTHRIQSHGGEYDHLITSKHPQAKIFKKNEPIPGKFKIGNSDENLAKNGYRFIALTEH